MRSLTCMRSSLGSCRAGLSSKVPRGTASPGTESQRRSRKYPLNGWNGSTAKHQKRKTMKTHLSLNMINTYTFGIVWRFSFWKSGLKMGVEAGRSMSRRLGGKGGSEAPDEPSGQQESPMHRMLLEGDGVSWSNGSNESNEWPHSTSANVQIGPEKFYQNNTQKIHPNTALRQLFFDKGTFSALDLPARLGEAARCRSFVLWNWNRGFALAEVIEGSSNILKGSPCGKRFEIPHWNHCFTHLRRSSCWVWFQWFQWI